MIKLLALILTLMSSAFATNNKPKPIHHQHGYSNLEINTENKSISIKYNSPLYSLTGFGHTPTTKLEKQKVNNAKYIWEKEWKKIFIFPGDLSCQKKGFSFTTSKEKNNYHEVSIHLKLECNKDPQKKMLQVGLLKFFKKLKYIDTKVFSQNKEKVFQVLIRSNNFKIEL